MLDSNENDQHFLLTLDDDPLFVGELCNDPSIANNDDSSFEDINFADIPQEYAENLVSSDSVDSSPASAESPVASNQNNDLQFDDHVCDTNVRRVESESLSWEFSNVASRYLNSSGLDSEAIKFSTMRSREPFNGIVYTSLKHKFQISLKEKVMTRSDPNMIIQAKLQLYDAKSNNVVEKVNKKDALEGEKHVFLPLKETCFEGVLNSCKVSATLSHHKTHRKYYFVIQFLHESELIMEAKSEVFKIYARKPNKKNYQKRKRKEQDAHPSKRAKTENWDVVQSHMKSLLKAMELLSEDEQKKACSMFRQELPA